MPEMPAPPPLPPGRAAGPVGVAVIGLGNAAKTHALALRELAAAGLLAVSGVYARDAGTRQAYAARHGFPAADDARALLADPRTAMLLLLTPPDARSEYLQLAIEQRKPVLMEKPVARTTAEAEQIVQAAARARLPLGVVLQHRLRPGVRRLGALLAEGALGRVGLVRLTVPWWRDQAYYDTPGRGTIARDGGGVLLSQAIHALDLLLHLLGPVTSVIAMAGTTLLHRMETEDIAVAGLTFARGALGAVVATTAGFPGGSEVLQIDAERASAELGHGELLLRWRDGRIERLPDAQASGTGADPMAFDHGLHRGVLQGFVEAVAAGRDAPAPARSALAVHTLIDAILRSSNEGRRVEIDGA